MDNLEIPYYFQYTVNFYPHLEPNIPHITERIKTFKTLSEKIGKERVIWRYDPFLTSNSPIIFTIPGVLERFEFVGNSLYEYTDKLVFSFLDPYSKLPPGLNPPTKEEELQIVDKILELNKTWKLQLATCAEDMNNPLIEHNRCIDPVLLKKLGVDIPDISKKDKTQRTSCGCYPSIDIGEYHTCRHGVIIVTRGNMIDKYTKLKVLLGFIILSISGIIISILYVPIVPPENIIFLILSQLVFSIVIIISIVAGTYIYIYEI